MFTLDDYIQLLEEPMQVDEEAIDALRSMLGYAPYCASARLLLLRALYKSGKRGEMNRQLKRALLSAPPEVSVYFLLRETKSLKDLKPKDDKPKGEKSLSYFEFIDRMTATAKKTGLGFDELARRYMQMRDYL